MSQGRKTRSGDGSESVRFVSGCHGGGIKILWWQPQWSLNVVVCARCGWHLLNPLQMLAKCTAMLCGAAVQKPKSGSDDEG